MQGEIQVGGIDDSFHTFNQAWHIEIDEQSDAEAGQPELRQNLSLVYWKNAFYRFQLHNNYPFHNKIDSVATAQVQPFVSHGNYYLSFERNIPQS